MVTALPRMPSSSQDLIPPNSDWNDVPHRKSPTDRALHAGARSAGSGDQIRQHMRLMASTWIEVTSFAT